MMLKMLIDTFLLSTLYIPTVTDVQFWGIRLLQMNRRIDATSLIWNFWSHSEWKRFMIGTTTFPFYFSQVHPKTRIIGVSFVPSRLWSGSLSWIHSSSITHRKEWRKSTSFIKSCSSSSKRKSMMHFAFGSEFPSPENGREKVEQKRTKTKKRNRNNEKRSKK